MNSSLFEEQTEEVLFFYSDAAGAKACLAQAYLLRESRPKLSIRIYSNKRYDFEKDWPFQVEQISDPALLDHGVLRRQVFTGTSHPDSSKGFEVRAIRWARANGISAASFVDHWVNFGLRFQEAREGARDFPDWILVPDEKGFALAKDEGVPEKCLKIYSNPYFRYIAESWKPQLTRVALLSQLAVSAGTKKILLYAPDPISLRAGAHGLRFDELSATHDLLQVLSNTTTRDFALVVKLHPLQPQGLLSLLKEIPTPFQIVIAQGVDNLELMKVSDLVIGFYSNLLLEAKMLKRQILRYFPDEDEKDFLNHLQIGTRVRFLPELADKLGRVLSGRHTGP